MYKWNEFREKYVVDILDKLSSILDDEFKIPSGRLM